MKSSEGSREEGNFKGIGDDEAVREGNRGGEFKGQTAEAVGIIASFTALNRVKGPTASDISEMTRTGNRGETASIQFVKGAPDKKSKPSGESVRVIVGEEMWSVPKFGGKGML